MDLDRCPKCGVQWRGWTRCMNCGFVPIGAGMKWETKKKKKKFRKYVEPGSGRGLLTLMVVGAAGFGGWKYWEMIHAEPVVVGEWDIVKSIPDPGSKPVLGNQAMKQAYLKFNEKGTLNMKVTLSSGNVEAQGRYNKLGKTMQVVGLRSTKQEGGGNYELPKSITANMTWATKNNLILYVKGTETVYLKRRIKSGGLAGIMQHVKSGGDFQPPGAMSQMMDRTTKMIKDSN